MWSPLTLEGADAHSWPSKEKDLDRYTAFSAFPGGGVKMPSYRLVRMQV